METLYRKADPKKTELKSPEQFKALKEGEEVVLVVGSKQFVGKASANGGVRFSSKELGDLLMKEGA